MINWISEEDWSCRSQWAYLYQRRFQFILEGSVELYFYILFMFIAWCRVEKTCWVSSTQFTSISLLLQFEGWSNILIILFVDRINSSVSISPETVARTLMKNWISRFSVLSEIVSGSSTQFTITERLGIKSIQTTTYHLQTDIPKYRAV